MQMQMIGTGALRALVVAAAMIFAGSAVAQMEQQPQGQEGGPQMELQQIQQRLAEVQEAALENNPGLEQQRDELEELVIRKMEEAGYDPDASMQTLESVQADMQDESLSDEERQQMLQEAQEAQQDLQEAQQVAMQDDEVVEAQQAFQDDLMEAMREEDPETDELIEEFQQIQQDMQGGMGGQQGGEMAPQ
ncbi:hypothetical protein [Aquisalimonas asiatica]|uniref:DUF4168 domain-containing protein n=1 Tax=Aquisalimonas asiatica TaxID=406100 RepID=A0A1H8PNL0_9GAMM|nr:hypothetical protein [Aquisalimonas asiatica]SEO43376.1 hypothetical protein SAMN04488052_10157 [Aquisalimonas asiatica]